MSSKPKFDPVVTRVKLNPEQAVLTCSCYRSGRVPRTAGTTRTLFVCVRNSRTQTGYNRATNSTASS